MTERNSQGYKYINKMIEDRNQLGLQKELDIINTIINNYINEVSHNGNVIDIDNKAILSLNNDKEVLKYIIEESKKVGIILKYNK